MSQTNDQKEKEKTINEQQQQNIAQQNKLKQQLPTKTDKHIYNLTPHVTKKNTEEQNEIIQLFNKYINNNYQSSPENQKQNVPTAKPQEDGSVRFEFSSDQEAIKFFQELATTNKNFVIKDEQGQILGYSKNGQLFNTKNQLYTSDSKTLGPAINEETFKKNYLPIIKNQPDNQEEKSAFDDDSGQNQNEIENNTNTSLKL